jgi:hypothetical protein
VFKVPGESFCDGSGNHFFAVAGFLTADLALETVFDFAGAFAKAFAAALAGLAGAFFAAAIFFTRAAAVFPGTMGLAQQRTFFKTPFPQASSTTSTRPHTLQLRKSPLFAFAIRASSFSK